MESPKPESATKQQRGRLAAFAVLIASLIGLAWGVNADAVLALAGMERTVNHGQPLTLAVRRTQSEITVVPSPEGTPDMGVAGVHLGWRTPRGIAPLFESFDRAMWVYGIEPPLTAEERLWVRERYLELLAATGVSEEQLALLKLGDGVTRRLRPQGVVARVSGLTLLVAGCWLDWRRRSV